MISSRFGSAISLVVLLLAGCLRTGDTGEDRVPEAVDAFEYYLGEEFPLDVDHSATDHSDMRLHDAAFNVDFAGYHSCTPDGRYKPGQTGRFTDIAFHGVNLFVGSSAGFCILDISDPTNPVFVAQYVGDRQNSSDLEVSHDGNYVFLTTQRNPIVKQPSSEDATKQVPRGVIVVNVKDKRNPAFESYYPVPTNGVHTASTYGSEDRQFVFIQTYDWIPPKELNETAKPPPVPELNAPGSHRVEVTELIMTPSGTAVLNRVSTYSLPRPAANPLVYWFPHDSYAQRHPSTGQLLLYIAYWDAGLVTLDISDPANPRLLSQYADKAPSRLNNYHDVKASETLIDGRHITVTAPEVEVAPETSVLRVFDTTNPARPVQLGTWKPPGDLGIPRDFLFSLHVFTLHEGRIYIGNNHAGVWVVDISTAENLRAPKSAGYYFPHGDAHLPFTQWSTSTDTWGAYYHNGYVYATEDQSGVHVLQFKGDRPAPPST